MRELALFAGAGGGLLGSRLLGWTTRCAVELNPFRRERLLQRQAEGFLDRFPVWDDVTKFDGRPWRGHVDVVSGGFPCQAFSTAARGRNNAVDLWPDMARIVGEVHPRHVLAENVQKYPIQRAAQDLYALGYSTRYACTQASDVGAFHGRSRWWLVAHADEEGQPRLPEHVQVARVPRLPPVAAWKKDLSRTLGMDDGVANRMDRLEALGDGQVPAMVVLAWEILARTR